MKQIKEFGILQTAKVVSVLYLIISAIIFIPLGIISIVMAKPDTTMQQKIFLFFVPLIYFIVGFIFVALACLLYNIVAKRVGGIAVEIED